MAESHEFKLADTLVWSDQDFSLEEFVESYQLPQVVMVEVGYCGVNERTTFSSGQILTLHCVRTVNKAVCQVPHINAVLVPMTCELRAEVIPMDCHDTIVTARQLSTLYQHIKYVRVMELGSTWNNNSLDTLKINDILHIKKIEHKNSVIKCKNLTTDEIVSILIDSTAVFVPLMEPKTYTLAQVKKNFGFPAKIRFLDRKAELILRASPAPGERQTQPLLADLGQLIVMEEVQNSDVIVTTVCSNLDEKLCLRVPTSLEIRVTVAEGFLSGDETYQKIVKTLDKQLKQTDLEAFEDLDVYQHTNAVKRTIAELSRRLSVEEASGDVIQHARQKMEEKKATLSRTKSKKKDEKPPPIPLRSSLERTNITAPVIPPKPGPKPSVKTPKKKEKKFRLGFRSPDWLKRKPSDVTSPSSDDEDSDSNYEEPLSPLNNLDNLYTSVDEIYEHPEESDSDTAEYAELDTGYVSATPRAYTKLVPKQPKSSLPPKPNIPAPALPIQPPPLPTSGPPKTQDEKQAIYEAIARFPQDLSGLSVVDVSRLLRYLGMASYVETFENELVDGSMLASMDQESLESLGVNNVFHVKKLMKFVGGWRPNV